MVDFNNRFSAMTPPTTDSPELDRFLREEFGRIAAALTDAVSCPAFGSLEIAATPASQSITTAYQLVTAWDTAAPVLPERATPSVASSAIVADEAGVYYLEAHCILATGSNHFIFAVHINGVATNFVASHDAAPHVSGLVNLSAGDSVDLRAKVDSGTHTLQIEYGGFSALRVSEVRKGL